MQERIFAEFKVVKLPTPKVVNEFNEPFKCCDEKRLVLAHATEAETWKNDVTSAWIKLSDVTDTIEFRLTKNGSTTVYTPFNVAFPSEPNAWFTTIKWQDVLNSDGTGCYKLELIYNISGVAETLTWGIYDLKPYSQETSKYTARLRVKFNLKQNVEGINFTNANVEDTIRFNGFIGFRQPNMEIDNLIYQDRTLKTVVRENINTYIIQTDPYTAPILEQLTDLYLLSENELYISDYNVFNNSHNILDVPTVVTESPEIDYLVEYQRSAVLTCTVSDRTNNKRTYY